MVASGNGFGGVEMRHNGLNMANAAAVMTQVNRMDRWRGEAVNLDGGNSAALVVIGKDGAPILHAV